MFKTLTRNPFPTAIVGLGMFWLLKNSSETSGVKRLRYESDGRQPYPSPDEASVKDQVEERFQSVKVNIQDHLSDWKEQANQQTQEWKDGAGQKMEKVKGYLQEHATVAREELNHLLENNPLAVGAVMLAVGAAVAAALPRSRPEDQWMGNSRDKMLEVVKTKVHSTVEDVTHKTGHMIQNVLQKEETNIG
jgi:ElaB/YqjD/DUF883 family membrane-anchored ribosome-binding protein